MANIGDMNIVPLFVKAKKPEQLIAAMHQNNVRHGTQFKYQIVHDGKHFFAWYYKDVVAELRSRERNPKLTRG